MGRRQRADKGPLLATRTLSCSVHAVCAHGLSNSWRCAQDTIAPVWRTTALTNSATASVNKNLAGDVPTLCAWPPSYKYYCWLDVTNNVETEVLPLYDNCAGSFPLIKQGPETFTCTDTDPRTQDGARRGTAAHVTSCLVCSCRLPWRDTVAGKLR